MAANITIAFRKGEASPESDDIDWGVRRYIDKLFVHFGPGLTIMFDDPQEGMDLINSFATVPPVELSSVLVDPNQLKLEV